MGSDKLPGKVKFSIFIMFIFLGILIRYPVIYSEFGVDSFFIHAMAQSLTDNGRGFWLLDATSYFGTYPFSYPSAAPFLLSSFSQVSGLDIMESIFILSIILGVLSFFTAYMLASIFFKNEFIIILIGFFYSSSPLLIKYTSMTFPSRGLFLVLVPLILWIFLKPFKNDELLKAYKIQNVKLFILAGIMIIFSFTIHYSAWLILAFLLVFICIKFGLKISNKYQPSISSIFGLFSIVKVTGLILTLMIIFNLIKLMGGDDGRIDILNSFIGTPITLFIWFLIGLLLMISFNWMMKFKNGEKSTFGTRFFFILLLFILILIIIGSFIHPFSSSEYNSEMNWFNLEGLEAESANENGLDPSSAITTLVTLMLGRYGFILILALIGLIPIIRFKEHSVSPWKPWFLICSALLILPFISLAPYPLEIFIIIITVFAGFGLTGILDITKKYDRIKLSQVVTVFIITAVLISSSYSISFRLNNEYVFTGDKNYIDDELMELAVYLDVNLDNGSFRDPDYIQAARLSTLTGKESRYKVEHDFQYLIWRDIDFIELEVSGIDMSWDTFLTFKESFYRPYKMRANFTILPREYYIGPSRDTSWINSTEYPDMEQRFYRVYCNDRSTIWLTDEDFDRSVVY